MDGPAPLTDDLSLLRRCAEGDRTALSALHRRHAGLCRRRAFEVLRNAQLADEAVQDAFLSLWQEAGRFDARRAQVRTWLCVLVHRRAVDVARREARHQVGRQAETPVEPQSYTAEELLDLTLDRRLVQSAVRRLRPAHRQVVELAYWGGLSQQQIAVHCEIPHGTVKSRMHEALARLAAILGEPSPAID